MHAGTLGLVVRTDSELLTVGAVLGGCAGEFMILDSRACKHTAYLLLC